MPIMCVDISTSAWLEKVFYHHPLKFDYFSQSHQLCSLWGHTVIAASECGA